MKKISSIIILICCFSMTYLLRAEENSNNLSAPRDMEEVLGEYNQKGDRKNIQNSFPEEEYTYLSTMVNGNSRDIFLGLTIGTSLNFLSSMSIKLSFYMRPYEKTVFVESDDKFYYQMKEKRYTIGLELDKYFFIPYTSYGIFLNVGIGGSFSEFEGTDIKEEFDSIPIRGGGILYRELFFGGTDLIIKLGYQYMKLPHVPDNRIISEVVLRY